VYAEVELAVVKDFFELSNQELHSICLEEPTGSEQVATPLQRSTHKLPRRVDLLEERARVDESRRAIHVCTIRSVLR